MERECPECGEYCWLTDDYHVCEQCGHGFWIDAYDRYDAAEEKAMHDHDDLHDNGLI